jgi:hypothetical protein
MGCGLFSQSRFALATFDSFLSKYGKKLFKKSLKNICKIQNLKISEKRFHKISTNFLVFGHIVFTCSL